MSIHFVSQYQALLLIHCFLFAKIVGSRPLFVLFIQVHNPFPNILKLASTFCSYMFLKDVPLRQNLRNARNKSSFPNLLPFIPAPPHQSNFLINFLRIPFLTSHRFSQPLSLRRTFLPISCEFSF